MIKDITLGQYFPLNSIVHKLDPRVKLFFTTAFIVMSIVSNNFVSLGLCFGITALTVLISKVPIKTVLKSLKPIVLVIFFTSILQIFYNTSGVKLFWRITTGGVLTALYMALRIILLITMSTMLTYTTSPTALTAGLDRIFAPLRKVGINFHVVTMIMTIALRFIPTLIDDVDKIMNAQKSRGANFEKGNLVQRAKALIPLFIPLMFNSIKHAYELSNAMICRCYNGGEGKTNMKALKFSGKDYFVLLLIVGFIAGIILLNIYCGEYNAEYTFNLAV